MALDVVVSSLTDASVSVRGKPFKFGSLRKRLSYLGQSQLPVKLKNLSSGDFVKWSTSFLRKFRNRCWQVRITASWALANICDALRNISETNNLVHLGKWDLFEIGLGWLSIAEYLGNDCLNCWWETLTIRADLPFWTLLQRDTSIYGFEVQVTVFLQTISPGLYHSLLWQSVLWRQPKIVIR